MGQVQEHVGPHQEKHLAAGVLFMEVFERVDRVVDPLAIGLVAAHRKGRVAGNGQLQHLDPLCGGRQLLPLLMRRRGGRQEPDRVQPALLPAALRQEQMAVVNRVEGAAENAESQGSG